MNADQTAALADSLREMIAGWRQEARALQSDGADHIDCRDGEILERVCLKLEELLSNER